MPPRKARHQTIAMLIDRAAASARFRTDDSTARSTVGWTFYDVATCLSDAITILAHAAMHDRTMIVRTMAHKKVCRKPSSEARDLSR